MLKYTSGPLLRACCYTTRLGLVPSAVYTLKRGFSSSSPRTLPFKIYNRSTASKILSYVPQPIKTFGSIVAGTGVTLLLAPGLILLVGPPLILGLFIVWRRMRQLKAQLHDKRWQDLASYHLVKGAPRTSNHMPYAIRSRIFDAIVNNEQGLGSKFASPMDQDISFTDLESLSQDFKANFGGINTAMQIEQYGMIIGGKRVATVNLVEREDKMRVEIKPKRGKMVVLDGDGSTENVIDVKK